MSAAPACDIHGPLPEGQQFCEHCAVPGLGFAARSIGDLQYRPGSVPSGEGWTLNLRLPALPGTATVQVRVARQRRTVSLVNGGERVIQFDELMDGTHHLYFYVRTDTRTLEGDGSVEARARGGQGDRPAVNINAEGAGHFIKVDMGSSEKPVDSWQLCALRDHPHAAVTLQPRKNSECVPNVVVLRPPAGELCRLIRGNRNIIGRGPPSHIELVRLGQATTELSGGISREALELELRSSGCVHLAVRNCLGAHINGQPLGKNQSKDIPLHAFESWQIIEFPGEISVRLKSIRSPSESGIVHSPWTDFGQIARDQGVGGMHVRVEVFGDRFDLVWVLDAVSVRDVSPCLPDAGIVFDGGECLYHIDTTGMDPLVRGVGRRKAFPLEPGAEWGPPSGRWKVPILHDGKVHP